MGMFEFDAQFPMFDSTPVENYFLLEYMPKAKGEFVKVYLYGLMNCYHPQQDMSVTQVARELEMDEETVLSAYRYWEKRRLIQRVSDNPPEYRYLNIKKQMMMGGDVSVDEEYEEFCEMVHSAFNHERSLHTNDLTTCYEWVTELKLKPETVILLINHMISIRGKNFTFKAAEKVAVMLAEQGAYEFDDAVAVLDRDKKVHDGSKTILRRMGMRREPTEDEMNLYQKWLCDWHYAPDAIEAACAETTKSRTPTFAYLDGILNGMMGRSGEAASSKEQLEQQRTDEQERIAPLKKILATLNVRDLSINVGTMAVYDDMRKLYPDDVIQLAAEQCAKTGGSLDRVMELLESWKNKNLQTVTDVQAYIRSFNEQGKMLSGLYEIMGVQTKRNGGDRALLQKWQNEWHFDPMFIAHCAVHARGTDKPMLYLNRMLEDFNTKGIRTIEAAEAAHQAWQQSSAAQNGERKSAPRGPKVVREQQYEQREYENSTEVPDWLKEDLEAANENKK